MRAASACATLARHAAIGRELQERGRAALAGLHTEDIKPDTALRMLVQGAALELHSSDGARGAIVDREAGPRRRRDRNRQRMMHTLMGLDPFGRLTTIPRSRPAPITLEAK